MKYMTIKMINQIRKQLWMLNVILALGSSAVLVACGKIDTVTEKDNVTPTVNGKVAEIIERGTLLVGTTGDYRPLSFCEDDGTYWGFGIEVAR
jgi:cyclohexadienyl dehydratase